MRLMSFGLTTDQVRARTKTVTRRLRWTHIQKGAMLRPVVKAMGLGPGGTVEIIDPAWFITVVMIYREPLTQLVKRTDYGRSEMILEGFPGMDPREFVGMFCTANHCDPDVWVTRIRFVYTRDQRAPDPDTGI